MNYTELKTLLNKCTEAYYKTTGSSSLITDEDFDMKLKQLEKMEKEQGYSDPDSPTQHPGSDLTGLKTCKHNRPMLSLENTYNMEEVKTWYDKMCEEHRAVYGKDDTPEVTVEYKYDGNSGCIRFNEGKIIKGLTRGDGIVGEDITKNIQAMDDFINIKKSFSKEARGEIIMEKSEFIKLNNEGKYANARNLASGSLKLLDTTEFKKRKLIFFAYWLEDSTHNKFSEDLDELKAAGFRVGDYTICKNYDEIVAAINNIEQIKTTLNIDIDGAVMKLNDKKLWESLGSTAKYPRWAKAYKYKQTEVETTVLSIDYQIGRTGKCTPVANLAPVFIEGSTVSRVTLNNKDYMELLDIRVGDTVKVIKAACIIPMITEVVSHVSDSSKSIFPVVCPTCGTTLEKLDTDHVDYFCPNENCSSRIINAISNYTHIMEIDGFADILIERLHDAGYLDSISDLYKLKEHKDEIVLLDRMGEKNTTKILANIEQSKSQEYYKFLASIGIHKVGHRASKVIIKKFSSIDSLMAASAVELEGLDGIGSIIADGIVSFFSIQKNIDFITYMKSIGMNMSTAVTKTTTSNVNISGMTFCITGALSRPRVEYNTMIEDAGGKIANGVTSKTNYLITNDKTTSTSKNKKANELNIPIINEQEFLDLYNK